MKTGSLKLNVDGIDFTYTSRPILKNVGLQILKSEIISIIGPNGAGKSTLLKCIDKILIPQKGSIYIDTMDVKKMGRMEVAKKMGYIPQKMTQIFPATVFDTILMGRRPHVCWKSKKRDTAIVLDIMELLNIGHLAMEDINQLSGGQQQNVFFAKALAQEPEVLLLDEPTSNLDIKHQLEVMEIIRNVVRDNKITAIISIHDLNMAARYSDKVIMMKDGMVYAAGEPSQVLSRESIKAVYDVEAIVSSDSGIPYIIPVSPVDAKDDRPNDNCLKKAFA